MLKAKLYHNSKGQPAGFKVSGHAGLAEAGSDILCAAVSVMAINTVNSLQTLTDEEFDIAEDENEAMLEVRLINEPGEKAILLLESFELACQSISKNKEYNPYFSFKREEI